MCTHAIEIKVENNALFENVLFSKNLFFSSSKRRRGLCGGEGIRGTMFMKTTGLNEKLSVLISLNRNPAG